MEFSYDGMSSRAGLAAGAFSIAAMIPALIIGAVLIAAMWKMFEKAGKPGWAALIPVYNTYVLYEIICGRGIAFLRLLIPIYHIYWAIKTMVNLAKAYGKDITFALGLIFLAPVFYCIIGFDKNTSYVGPQEM